MRKSQPWYRRMLGKAFHLLASVWVVGPVKDTQCGFKGFTRDAAHDLFARQQIHSIVFDVELIFLARKRGYRSAIVPIRWADRRGSRMRARPGLALRVALGPVPDPAPPPRARAARPRRPAGSVPRRGSGRRLASADPGVDRRHRAASRLARRRLPIVAILVLRRRPRRVAAGRRRARARSASTSSPTTRRRTACSPASRSTTRSVQQTGGFGLFYYPPPFVLAILPFAPLDPTIATWAWVGLSLAALLGGVALMPVSRDGPLADAPPRRAVVAGRLRVQARPGGAAAVPAVRRRLALARPAAGRSAGRRRAGAIVKIQPGLVLVWALLTRRWAAVAIGAVVLVVAAAVATLVAGGLTVWSDYLALLRNVSDPITTPHNFTPGAVAYQLGLPTGPRRDDPAAQLDRRRRARSSSRRVRGLERGLVPRRGRPPASCSRRSSGTITRCSCCCPSRGCSSGGQWWAVLVPLATSRCSSSASRPRPPTRSPSGSTLVGARRRSGCATAPPRARPSPRRRPRDRSASTGRRVVGLAVTLVAMVDLLAVEPLLRRASTATSSTSPTRSSTAGRGRPGTCRGAIGPNDVILDRRPLLRAVRAVPGDRLHAARGDHRPGDGRPVGDRDQRRPRGGRRRPGLVAARPRSAFARSSIGSGSSLLLGFSTQIWWVTTRGGVWHTGQLIATMLTLALPHRAVGQPPGVAHRAAGGRRVPDPGAARLRVPFYALLLAGDAVWEPRRWPWRSWSDAGGRRRCRRSSFFFWYNAARFGSPFESGYALATAAAVARGAAPARACSRSPTSR